MRAPVLTGEFAALVACGCVTAEEYLRRVEGSSGGDSARGDRRGSVPSASEPAESAGRWPIGSSGACRSTIGGLAARRKRSGFGAG